MRPEKCCDSRMTTPIIPGYERQVRCKVLSLHGCEQSVKLKKTMSVMQQWIVHDETGQFLSRLPATISKRVAQEHQSRHQPGEPLQRTHTRGDGRINVQDLTRARQGDLNGAALNACQERAVPDANVICHAFLLGGDVKHQVIFPCNRPKAQP